MTNRYLFALMATALLLGASEAQAAIDVDFGQASFEVVSADTVRIHNVMVVDYGAYWADLHWGPDALALVPVAAAPEAEAQAPRSAAMEPSMPISPGQNLRS